MPKEKIQFPMTFSRLRAPTVMCGAKVALAVAQHTIVGALERDIFLLYHLVRSAKALLRIIIVIQIK